MTTQASFLKGAVRLGTGQIISQMCSFIRSIILARLITPEDFGIAATFTMTFGLLEMVSNIAAQTLLVQAPDGDDIHFQATGHLLLFIRGASSAVILLLLAAPLSELFGVPQARWVFYWLALIPLARGVSHLDISRLQRNMRFTPQVVVDSVSDVLITLLVWPIAAWLRDYSAMLWILLLRAILPTLGSHIAAERRYIWKWRREYARRFFSFGWPLLVNGLLMYGIFQGDRLTIGVSPRMFPQNTYNLADLGIYSVAFLVTMAPSQLCVNVTSSLFLPLLSRVQTVRDQFTRRYAVCAHLVSFLALAVAVPFIITGYWVVPLLYGPKYVTAGAIVGWLSVMWAMRIVRAGPTLAAIALGDTRNSMISNMARTTALLGMMLAASVGGPLVWIAICGFVGEVMATGVCLGRLSSKHHLSPRLSLYPLTVVGAGIGVAAIARAMAVGLITGIAISLAVLCLCAGTMLLCFPELRQNLRSVLTPLESPLSAQKVTN